MKQEKYTWSSADSLGEQSFVTYTTDFRSNQRYFVCISNTTDLPGLSALTCWFHRFFERLMHLWNSCEMLGFAYWKLGYHKNIVWHIDWYMQLEISIRLNEIQVPDHHQKNAIEIVGPIAVEIRSGIFFNFS